MMLRPSREYVSLLRRGWVRVLLLLVVWWWCGGGCLRHRDGGWSRRWWWADANHTNRVDGCLDLLAAMNTSKPAPRNPFFTFVVINDIVVGGRSSIRVDLVELHGEWQVDFADDFPEILFARLVEAGIRRVKRTFGVKACRKFPTSPLTVRRLTVRRDSIRE
jgi:hypothetical protein